MFPFPVFANSLSVCGTSFGVVFSGFESAGLGDNPIDPKSFTHRQQSLSSFECVSVCLFVCF